jgi:flagellar biosynthesis chaperone FliJ
MLSEHRSEALADYIEQLRREVRDTHAYAERLSLRANDAERHLAEAQQRIQALEQAREQLITKWRERSRKAESEREQHERLTDRGVYLLGKMESITRCADELAAVAAPPDPTE